MSPDRARSIRPQALFALAAAVAALLIVLLGLELRAGAAGQDTLLPRASRAAGEARGDSMTASPSPGSVANWMRVVLARPLFSPQRRPPSVVVSGPQQPRLAGIILAPGGRRAIFAGAGDARGTVVGVGQQAGAWHVIAIDDKGVRVRGPDGIRVLQPAWNKSGHDGSERANDLPTHPTILDILRSRNAAPGGGLFGGLMGGRLPLHVPLPQNGADKP